MKPESGDGNPHRSDTFREMIRSQRKDSQKEDRLKKESHLKKMAGATGLEPATSAVTGQRSNQLSYAPARTGSQNVGKRHLPRQPVCITFAEKCLLCGLMKGWVPIPAC